MLTRRHFLTAAAALPAAGLITSPAWAAKSAIFAIRGVAINGMDPVAYFTQSRPVRGSASHALDWQGAEMRFSSAETKAMFEANPEKYAPKYGGYCAYAVSKGYTASTDPAAWTVYQDRLYLNFSKDVRSLWEKDIPGNVRKANANWPSVLEA